jgi:hypothetical protein
MNAWTNHVFVNSRIGRTLMKSDHYCGDGRRKMSIVESVLRKPFLTRSFPRSPLPDLARHGAKR